MENDTREQMHHVAMAAWILAWNLVFWKYEKAVLQVSPTNLMPLSGSCTMPSVWCLYFIPGVWLTLSLLKWEKLLLSIRQRTIWDRRLCCATSSSIDLLRLFLSPKVHSSWLSWFPCLCFICYFIWCTFIPRRLSKGQQVICSKARILFLVSQKSMSCLEQWTTYHEGFRGHNLLHSSLKAEPSMIFHHQVGFFP